MTGKRLLIFFLILAVVDFTIPFYVLNDVAQFTGSYLFWSLLTLVIIVLGIAYTGTWGEYE